MNAVLKNALYIAIWFSGVFLCTLSAQDEEKRPLELDDVLNMKQVKEAIMSPDGQWVAFVIEQLDFERMN